MPTNEAILGIEHSPQEDHATGWPTPACESDQDLRPELPLDPTLQALILYDSLACAAQASALLQSASQKADETIPWNVSPWRFDILQLPPASEAALAEAEEAHLIVIALSCEHSVFPWLVDWLEQWAARRRVREAAVAVWSGGRAEAHSALTASTLMRFARRHGLRLILGEDQEQPLCHLTA